MDQDNSLSNLLNDETFIRWVKGESSTSENVEWNRWLLEDPYHHKLVDKAKKIISMPFNEWDSISDKKERLYKLKKSLENSPNLKFIKFENKHSG